MKHDADNVLDECLGLLQSEQATLEECLAHYPHQAAELRPLLEVALEVRHLPPPDSSPTAFAAGKERMLRTLAEKKRRQPVSPSPFSRYAWWLESLSDRKRLATMPQRVPALRFALGTALILVLLTAGGLFLRTWTSTIVGQTATLADVSGVVEVMPAGGDTWQPATPGSRVTTGDRIRTSTSTVATLTFFDGSTTSLEAETELSVSELTARRDGQGKVIVLQQWIGRTYNRVQRLLDPSSRFEIETPTAVTAVRGTVFAVDVEADGTTEVAVGEGLVEVTAQNATVEVLPDHATTVQPDLPPASAVPAPAPLPPATPQPSPTPGPFQTQRPSGLTDTPMPTLDPIEPRDPTEPPAERPTRTLEPVRTPQPTRPPVLTPVPTRTPVATAPPVGPVRTPTATQPPVATAPPVEQTTRTPEPTAPPVEQPTRTPEPTAPPVEQPVRTPEPTNPSGNVDGT